MKPTLALHGSIMIAATFSAADMAQQHALQLLVAVLTACLSSPSVLRQMEHW